MSHPSSKNNPEDCYGHESARLMLFYKSCLGSGEWFVKKMKDSAEKELTGQYFLLTKVFACRNL